MQFRREVIMNDDSIAPNAAEINKLVQKAMKQAMQGLDSAGIELDLVGSFGDVHGRNLLPVCRIQHHELAIVSRAEKSMRFGINRQPVRLGGGRKCKLSRHASSEALFPAARTRQTGPGYGPVRGRG